MRDEHDDDLDSAVIEGEEIETEKFEQAEDEEEVAPIEGVTNLSRSVDEDRIPAGAKEEEEEPDDESADTI